MIAHQPIICGYKSYVEELGVVHMEGKNHYAITKF